MPFLQTRFAVLTALCLLGACFLPQPAAARPWGEAASLPGAAAEFSEPLVLPPLREPRTRPEVLRGSMLEALARLEDEARLEAEAEERLAAEAELARAASERQAEEEKAEVTRARGEARARAVAEAVRAASLPSVAVVPAKREWPLPALADDQAWNTPEIVFLYGGSRGEAEIRSIYRRLLRAAAHGNPRAMLVLAEAHDRWGAELGSSFAALYPPMCESAYWRDWAERLTGPDWVELRFAELAPTKEDRLIHYRAAAQYANAEALYRLALEEDRPEFLIAAALAGHSLACSTVAGNLSRGEGGFPASPELASFYLWRGALAGDASCMLACSELFYQGRHGFPPDKRRASLFALLALETAEGLSGGEAETVLPAARRHWDGLSADMGLTPDAIWQIRQELEIFRAAPAEEEEARLVAAKARRAGALFELENELHAVREALDAEGEAEPDGHGALLAERRRLADNRRFFLFGLAGLALLLGGYAALRLSFYDKIARFMSAGGRA